MPARQTVSELAAHAGRGPGTDAERRAAAWLAGELRRGGHEVKTEPFWCRPNWALAHAWHVALAIAGSLVAVPVPWLGFALLAAALTSLVSDGLIGLSPGRRLTPERASQNVIACPHRDAGDPRPRLLIVANYDAGRTGFIHGRPMTALRHALARITGGRGPGWLGWLTLLTAWLAATALVRATHGTSNLLRVAQFVPTAAMVLALALLLEAARAPFGPAAADNASGAAVALALYGALATSPPAHLRPELVLVGAHEGGGIGLRRYLRARRRELTRRTAVVLCLAPSAAGEPRTWTSRGTSRAFPARLKRLPTVTLGALDARGRVPHSHQPSDIPEAVDASAIASVLAHALRVVSALDAERGAPGEAAHPPATAIPA